MTLAPVFRSEEGTALLRERGILDRLAEDIADQRAALHDLELHLAEIIGEQYRRPATATGSSSQTDMEFLQDHFFLLLFRNLFRTLGAGDRLAFYTRLNVCIKGIITAADNLFDHEFKELIPLRLSTGVTFGSIVQLMTFERLVMLLGQDAEAAKLLPAGRFREINRDLLTRLTFIGALEGSEEDGVASVPGVTEMVDRVHRIRGGALFSLAFCAPLAMEKDRAKWTAAEVAIAKLGTAFQIVDDLTDFEFDLFRESNNLLVSQITHHGSAEERAHLGSLSKRIHAATGEWEERRVAVIGEEDAINQWFQESALDVLRIARREAREAFEGLQALGFWFDPADSDEVVHAIVGLEGVHRMGLLVERDRQAAQA